MELQRSLVQEYLDSCPRYDAVVSRVRGLVEDALRSAAVEAEVTGRAKDPQSLATKLLTKSRAGTGYTSLAMIPDLAGVRIITKHAVDCESARQAIRTAFPDAQEDDKSAQLEPDTFRYRGVHFQITPAFEEPELQGLQCEIQLRTRAEHLWSDLSHELFYKSPGSTPAPLRRRFNRLIALVELFDMEVDATMYALSTDPSAEYRQIFLELERQFSRLLDTPLGINRELSLELISSLSKLPPLREGASIVVPRIQSFIQSHRDKLVQIYQRLREAPGRNPFTLQPESLLIWFLVETSKYDLKANWVDAEWDLALLEDLSIEWGVTLPE